ncbi:hypothetical protein UA75_24050 [Actinoalloteichus sp. GBA129-24]|nr:hypothetical protein UA75_24050 [Actinoalloteichus sp. GBA129-24]
MLGLRRCWSTAASPVGRAGWRRESHGCGPSGHAVSGLPWRGGRGREFRSAGRRGRVRGRGHDRRERFGRPARPSVRRSTQRRDRGAAPSRRSPGGFLAAPDAQLAQRSIRDTGSALRTRLSATSLPPAQGEFACERCGGVPHSRPAPRATRLLAWSVRPFRSAARGRCKKVGGRPRSGVRYPQNGSALENSRRVDRARSDLSRGLGTRWAGRRVESRRRRSENSSPRLRRNPGRTDLLGLLRRLQRWDEAAELPARHVRTSRSPSGGTRDLPCHGRQGHLVAILRRLPRHRPLNLGLR